MFQIKTISSSAKQKQSLVLPDGTQISLTIYYVPLQIGWFIKNITYKDFSLDGLRICNSPNLLYQYRNQIPFGLACFSAFEDREPTQQQDFISGAAKLYILSAEEVKQYTELLSGEI